MGADLLLHPAFALIAGAIPVALLRPGHARSAVALAVPLLALVLAWRLPDGAVDPLRFLDYELVLLRVDALSRLFAIIFALMAFGGALFGLGQPRRSELPSAFLYAGAALGVALAGDLLTVFAFWELMAVGSTLVLWSAGTQAAYRSSMRYLAMHLLGGVLLMAGIAAHVADTGSLAFGAMKLDTTAHWLICAAFLVNAGAPPVSAWLPDAYPEASWSGMVFLSAFTTKIAVYALIRGFPGAEPLVYFGLFMVFYGILYALLENDMRRILAYSIVNQVGFMVTGVGIGTAVALNGAAAHAFTHILYKALLLMSAGSVLRMTGKRNCTDLGGLFRTMPLTTVCGIVGALAISSFPLTSGFISKSMIAQAAGDLHLFAVWMLLAAASAGVFLHAGIKFPWFVFFQRDSGLRPPDPPASMRAAMVLFAALCVGIGVFYESLYRLLPFQVEYVPYTGAHVLAQLQLLLFSGLAFFVMLPWLRRTPTVTLDVDWIWRRALPALFRAADRVRAAAADRGAAAVSAVASSVASWIDRWHGPDGLLARTWHTRSMGMWVLVMMLAVMLAQYLVWP